MSTATLAPPGTYQADKWSEEEFEKWRHIQDPEADKVAELLVKHPNHGGIYQVIADIDRNDDPVNKDIFERIRPDQKDEHEDASHDQIIDAVIYYFNDAIHLEPTPELKAVYNAGGEFFRVHATSATMVLAVRSLLKQYAAYNATNVLVSTRMLDKFPHRRILETMQFVIDVMDPKALEPDGYGIRSIQKLRLVHAMVRMRIKYGIGLDQGVSWTEENIAEWGLPINQQDMIFAIHTFSIEVIDGIKAAGFPVTEGEVDAYYKTWHAIGRALGVRDEINPPTYEQGKKLQDKIYGKQFKAQNPNGPKLSEPLLKFMDELLPFADQDDVYSMIKVYNDEEDYKIFTDYLQIPLHKADPGFLALLRTAINKGKEFLTDEYRAAVGHEEKHRFLSNLGTDNLEIVERLVTLSKTWKGRHFRISDGFGTGTATADAKVMSHRPKQLGYIIQWCINGIMTFFDYLPTIFGRKK